MVALFVSACSDREPDATDSGGEVVASTQDELSGVGVEKVIPLRMVHLLDCNPKDPRCMWKGVLGTS